MESNELQALLEQLRQAQDRPSAPPATATAPAGAGAPSAAAQAGEPSQLEQILSSLVPTTAAPATQANPPSSAQPSQSELSALLASLRNRTGPNSDSLTPAGQARPPPRQRDLTQLSFPEALPILQRLSADELFIDALQRVQAQQSEAERELKEERDQLIQRMERSIGSSHMRASRLRGWDREALERWAKVKANQQNSLQQLGVPTFSVTKDPIILKRQERVIAVLVGFLEDAEE